MALLPFLALLLLAQDRPAEEPQNKPPQKCSLSGTVVDSVTGAPLNKVALRLEPSGREGGTAAITESDGKGQFALVDLDPGAYHLRGNRSGYLDMLYGARGADSGGTVIKLEAGQALSALSFKLPPAGAIAGTIRDSDGEPIEDARVDLGRIVYGDRGKPRLERVRSAYSDDRGEYRFHGLPPGKYYISAVENRQSGWGDVDRSANTGPAEVSVPTFYPGVPDSSTASPVEVAAGKRVSAIDVTLLKLRVVCVSGRVAIPAARGRLIIELEAANAAMGNYRATTSAKNAAGDFQFCRVPSGSYMLAAYAEGLSARVPVNVGSVDVSDIRLALAPGADIQGRVVAEGPEKPRLTDFCVRISQDGRNLASVCGVGGFKEGAFTFRHWRPDHYDVAASGLPRGFYIKSIRSGEADVLADGLTISGPGTVSLEVVLSPDGSALSGTVLDKNEQPVAGATVLLAPEQRSRFDLFAHITTDQHGRYEFPMLAPGKYKLFAWDDVTPNEWNNPDFLKDYEKQAEKADLEPKAKATVNLHLAIPPEAQ